MTLLGLGQPQDVQDDLVHRLAVEQRLHGVVVDHHSEQQLGVLPGNGMPTG